jgi:hypothetical protein
MPSPEELGVGRVAIPDAGARSFDWSVVHRRFQEAGATCVHIEHLPQGGCRFIGLLPSQTLDRQHRIQIESASEHDTAQQALRRLAEWQNAAK